MPTTELAKKLIQDVYTRPGWGLFKTVDGCCVGVLTPSGKVYAHGYDGVLDLENTKPVHRAKQAREFIASHAVGVWGA